MPNNRMSFRKIYVFIFVEFAAFLCKNGWRAAFFFVLNSHTRNVRIFEIFDKILFTIFASRITI